MNMKWENIEGCFNHFSIDMFLAAGRICFGRSLGCLAGGKEEKELDTIIHCNREMFRLSAALKFSLPLYKIFPTPLWLKVAKLEDILVE